VDAPISQDDVVAALERICASNKGKQWIRDREIDLGDKRWRPSAVVDSGNQLLYVSLLDGVPRFASERLRLAADRGITPTVALRLAALFNPEVVKLLAEVEAEVIVLDDYVRPRQLEPRSVFVALAEIDIPVEAGLRRQMSDLALGRVRVGTAQQKGRRLEALLTFVFSQIDGVKVIEHNYRTATQEIDIVLQIDGHGSRVWQQLGAPFILVEAKNRADKASQQMVSVLIQKLQTKRGTSRVGVLVSLAGFTMDAKEEELRLSRDDVCVVMVDRGQLERLVAADDLSSEFETQVRRALLR